MAVKRKARKTVVAKSHHSVCESNISSNVYSKDVVKYNSILRKLLVTFRDITGLEEFVDLTNVFRNVIAQSVFPKIVQPFAVTLG